MHIESTHLACLSAKLTGVQGAQVKWLSVIFHLEECTFLQRLFKLVSNLWGHISHGSLLCMIPPGKTKQRAVIAVFLTANAPVDVWAEAMHCGLMVVLKLDVGSAPGGWRLSDASAR